MTEFAASLTWKAWLANASRPSAAANAVSARTRGRNAARRAPHAAMRSPSGGGGGGGGEVLEEAGFVDAGDDVVHGRLEGLIAHPEARALDEHVLRGGLLEAGALEDLLGLGRLAGEVLGLRELHRADLAAEEERDGDEGEPPERGRLPVARAPAAHAGRDGVRALQGGHSGLLIESL